MPSRLTALVRWSARVFGDDIAARVFAPLVADCAHEIHASPTTRDRAVAHVRWAAAFAHSALRLGAGRLVRGNAPRADALSAGRTLALSCAASVLLIVTPVAWSLRSSAEATVSGEPLTLSSYARRQEVASRVAWTLWPAAVAAFSWRLGSRTQRRHRLAGLGLAWGVPAALLVAPEFAQWWLVEGGPYGRPSPLVTFIPTLSLLMVAWWLGPAVEVNVATNRGNPMEAR